MGFSNIRIIFSESLDSTRMTTQNPQSLIKKLVPTWKFLKLTSPEKYGTGPVGLAKNMWGELPEVTSALFLAVFSLGGIYKSYLNELETGYLSNKAYKDTYTVYRPNDPRLEHIKAEWFENGSPAVTSSKIQ